MALANDIEQGSAPGALELVREFVNTRDVEEGTDALTTTEGLADWLCDHELVEARFEISEPERLRAIELREALRDLLLANNGHELADPDSTYATLNGVFAHSTLRVRFHPDGEPDLVPSGSGLESVLARIAAIVRESIHDGEFRRLKVCPADDCLWAFWDRSKNRSRTWCNMGDCGNRAKVRAFRERRAHS